ncbi:MAG: hypothetical protein FJ271_24125 [Planctomycetes bacterium]|nr:hypothetical protein [Planctomycetota bacterium]
MADTTVPANGGQGDASAAAASSSSWIASIPDNDLRGWVQTKGFREPIDALNSYRNLEKLIGADKAGRTVLLPAKWDDAAEVGAFFDKLGRPKEPGGYTMPKEGVDAEMATWAQSTFHEAGLTQRQAELVIGKWQDLIGKKTTAAQEAYRAGVAQEEAALKKEWGAAYDDQVKKARAVAKIFGVDEAIVNRLEGELGFGDLMRFFSDLARRVGEDPLERGQGQQSFDGAMTPDAAKAELTRLGGDKEFVRRYLAHDTDASKKMEQVHSWAFGNQSLLP